MIAIIDYGVGNLFSLKSSLGAIGEEAVVTRDEQILNQADHIILPGVGAFGDAVQKLRDTGMFQVVLNQAAKGKPILGICLGMQLLFEKSFEYGGARRSGPHSGGGAGHPHGDSPESGRPPHGVERPPLPKGTCREVPSSPAWRRGSTCTLSTPSRALTVKGNALPPRSTARS